MRPANLLRAHWVLTALLVTGCVHLTTTAPTSPHRRWLRLELGGQPVGRALEETEPLPQGGWRTHATSSLHLGRLGTMIEMRTESTFEEDEAGQPRALRLLTSLSRQATTAEVRFDGSVATISESAGGQTHTRTEKFTGPLLGPEGLRRANAARLKAAGDTLELVTWSPLLQAPQRLSSVVEAVEALTVDGVARPVVKVRTLAEGESQPRLSLLDASGREVRSAIELPFGTMVALETAKEPPDQAGELPEDLFSRTLLRSNVRLAGARSLERLRLEVELLDGVALPPVASDDTRVIGAGSASPIIEIERQRAPEHPADAQEGPSDPSLGASALIDPTDPLIKKLASEATAGARDPWERAQRLTRWVTEHMTFDAGVAFAPASELARDRHGTCAGYAVLLASLLRAAAIPARFDLGLVYVNGVFAGHAWVEARIGGRWLPLDAALPSDGPADAARLALARDFLDRGPSAALASFGQILGHARITVLGYTPSGGNPVEVESGARPFSLEGARYSNPGLGLSITAPPGYRFTQVDGVWPDPVLVGLEGPGGQVTLSERTPVPGGAAALAFVDGPCDRTEVSGREACARHQEGLSRLTVIDGAQLYVLEARGPAPRELLTAMTGALRLRDLKR